MNPSSSNPDPATAGQPVYDPQSVQITPAGIPRSGLEPTPPQFAASSPQPEPQPFIPPPSAPAPPDPVMFQQPPIAINNQAPVLAPPVSVGGAMPVAPQLPGQPLQAVPKPAAKPNSTQNSLHIAEIRDGIVIMNDGSFRSVVMVKSINFDLMSPQEQEGIEYGYQSFLNSLYFPIQIFIRSRKVDLRPYIERLDKIRTEHDNMLLALLMEDYINYMQNLSQQTNIMDKNFYIVIPFFPIQDVQKALTPNKNFLTGVTKLFDRSEQHVVINESDLENAKSELRNRVQSVLGGLQQCSIQGLPLDTQELIELYYDSYNPDTATRQQLKDFNNMTADIITKGQGTAPQAHLKRELQ
jgi:hypothetical protein